MTSIDLNADLGESFGNWSMGDDRAMLSIVTSANIACGFHAGDPVQMSEVVDQALANNVAIGAHPGFHDLRGFGRRRIEGIPQKELSADLVYQIGALQGIAQSNGAVLGHVKLHGALYNMAHEDIELAKTCVDAVQGLDKSLKLVVMPNSVLEKAAIAASCPVICEIFADRAYNDDATLVSRSQQGAMIKDAQLAADRMIKFVETGSMEAASARF